MEVAHSFVDVLSSHVVCEGCAASTLPRSAVFPASQPQGCLPAPQVLSTSGSWREKRCEEEAHGAVHGAVPGGALREPSETLPLRGSLPRTDSVCRAACVVQAEFLGIVSHGCAESDHLLTGTARMHTPVLE